MGSIFVEPPVASPVHQEWEVFYTSSTFWKAERAEDMLQLSASPTLNYKVLCLFKNLKSWVMLRRRTTIKIREGPGSERFPFSVVAPGLGKKGNREPNHSQSSVLDYVCRAALWRHSLVLNQGTQETAPWDETLCFTTRIRSNYSFPQKLPQEKFPSRQQATSASPEEQVRVCGICINNCESARWSQEPALAWGQLGVRFRAHRRRCICTLRSSTCSRLLLVPSSTAS